MKITEKKSKLKNLKDLVKIIEASGAFDSAHYRTQLRGTAKKHNSLISHYLNEGWKAGLNPHPCFDTNYYLTQNEDVLALNANPFLHFIFYGHREDRHISENFSLRDYRKRHPEIETNGVNPLKHFSAHYISTPPLPLPGGMEQIHLPIGANLDEKHLLKQAMESGLFDPQWYRSTYDLSFESDIDAFRDYQFKSTFSTVNPSIKFDTETYHRLYNDVYHAQMSPLTHYLLCGRDEGRVCPPATLQWQPSTSIDSTPWLIAGVENLKVAICLHIFYEDYIERFALALKDFPIEVDVLVTIVDPNLEDKTREVFRENIRIKRLMIRCVPNRGRNFGPLLTEYGDELNSYDLFCHLHSKKSLYSGREQHQWADYLTEYLLNDKSVVSKVLNAFYANEHLGIFYPTTFWMMPSWVNHMTMNKAFVRDWYKTLDIDPEIHDFLSYPAGGMFWGRPKALAQLLNLEFNYDDFPCEPLPNDGSPLHGLERALGPLVEWNGYEQFFYHPGTAKLTTDQSYIMQNYHSDMESLQNQVKQFSHVSFDVFDTLVRREYTVADYAKLILGQELSLNNKIIEPQDFVSLRNQAEYNLRKLYKFEGDVRIDAIYLEIAKVLNLSEEEADQLMRREFELDLNMILPKNEMVDIFNGLGASGHILWVISDTYYTSSQVSLMLKKAGITVPYRLIVSSEEKKRKDNGSMWVMIKQDLIKEGISTHIHVGDNVVADSQIPGDLGINTIHILHPMDKWRALGFPAVLEGAAALNEAEILKWGPLISSVGRYPYMGD